MLDGHAYGASTRRGAPQAPPGVAGPLELQRDARERCSQWRRNPAGRQWGRVRKDYTLYGARGTPSRTIMTARAPTAGVRTGCSPSVTIMGSLCFALASWNGATG